jgi:hypothetical protein
MSADSAIVQDQVTGMFGLRLEMGRDHGGIRMQVRRTGFVTEKAATIEFGRLCRQRDARHPKSRLSDTVQSIAAAGCLPGADQPGMHRLRRLLRHPAAARRRGVVRCRLGRRRFLDARDHRRAGGDRSRHLVVDVATPAPRRMRRRRLRLRHPVTSVTTPAEHRRVGCRA